jgi:ATP-binding cassette subfamily B (MDR/TAP) protein 1
LDATARLLVFEAIKRWRKKMTTVVITHDLSQITAQDFVYVLSHGRVIEQGYRYDLERIQGGEFRSMMQTQRATGGFLPVKDLEPALDWADVVVVQGDEEDGEDGINAAAAALSRRSLHSLHAISIVAGHTTPPIRRIRRVAPLEDLSVAFGHNENGTLHATAMEASRKRRVADAQRRRRDALLRGDLEGVKVEGESPFQIEDPPPSFWQLLREVYPTVPSKGFVSFGLVVCVASGAMTPVFSWLLSKLLFEVSIGAERVEIINVYGGVVLGVAAGDGFLIGLKYFVMETAAMKWVNFMRKLCFDLILSQDKKWFDDSRNSPAKMVQVLIKDGDDARVLMAEVLGQCVVVAAMLTAGLTWALVRGWQLTLVGVAIAPIFAVIMGVQNTWVSRCELRRKLAKEEVSKAYYEVCVCV